jgi:hypothetical protein
VDGQVRDSSAELACKMNVLVLLTEWSGVLGSIDGSMPWLKLTHGPPLSTPGHQDLHSRAALADERTHASAGDQPYEGPFVVLPVVKE